MLTKSRSKNHFDISTLNFARNMRAARVVSGWSHQVVITYHSAEYLLKCTIYYEDNMRNVFLQNGA